MSQPHDDFAFEDSPGIPAPLPAGERVLWQGSPDWKTLALSPFHARKVALWFGAIALFEVLWTLGHGEALGAALPGLARTLALGAVAVGVLATLAWLNGRVTIYTLTNRRLLIRFGVALQITMNLPFTQLLEANVRIGRDGIGDIPLALRDASRVGYVVLWPHVRPWRLTRPQPMLRAVPNAARVAALLGTAMREAESETAIAASRPVPGRAAAAPTRPSSSGAPATIPVAGLSS